MKQLLLARIKRESLAASLAVSVNSRTSSVNFQLIASEKMNFVAKFLVLLSISITLLIVSAIPTELEDTKTGSSLALKIDLIDNGIC